MHADELSVRPPDPDDGRLSNVGGAVASETAPGRGDCFSAPDQEVLTYDEAAKLLKVSPRTLERWTREGLVPYIRLPQRGRWSGVRFSRSQLLRWLRKRTVRAR